MTEGAKWVSLAIYVKVMFAGTVCFRDKLEYGDRLCRFGRLRRKTGLQTTNAKFKITTISEGNRRTYDPRKAGQT